MILRFNLLIFFVPFFYSFLTVISKLCGSCTLGVIVAYIFFLRDSLLGFYPGGQPGG